MLFSICWLFLQKHDWDYEKNFGGQTKSGMFSDISSNAMCVSVWQIVEVGRLEINYQPN